MHGEGTPIDITNFSEGVKKPTDKSKIPGPRPDLYVEDEYDRIERLKRFEELLDNREKERERDKKE